VARVVTPNEVPTDNPGYHQSPVAVYVLQPQISVPDSYIGGVVGRVRLNGVAVIERTVVLIFAAIDHSREDP